MRTFLEKAALLRIGWNRKNLTEADFYRLCRRFRITVVEMPLRTNGFYYCVKRRHFIAVDSKLPAVAKLLVMFHELAHYLMHAPDTGATANFHGIGRRTKKEAEADAFAICALIPRSWIESRTPQELIEDEGFTAEMIRSRQALLELYGL
jgi:Zn-dependent peptidase ImmA (M78 family)